MAMTPGSNKKSKNKGGTPQGKGGSTPQGTVMTKTPQSQSTPKFQKGQKQTPGSHKSGGATPRGSDGMIKTPQSEKGPTPKSQKGKSGTPGSEKVVGISPKLQLKGSTPQFKRVPGTTPKSEKGQAATLKTKRDLAVSSPKSSGKKPKLGTSEKLRKSVSPGLKAAISPSNKSPKNLPQHLSAAGSPQKKATPVQSKAGTGTPSSEKISGSNKKRKVEEEDSSSYDSAEEDFEALIGHPKKLKTEGSSASPKKVTPRSGDELSAKKQPTPVSGKLGKAEKRLEEMPIPGMKRSFESDSDDDDDDEEGDDDGDDDDSETETPPASIQKPIAKDVAKKMKLGDVTKTNSAVERRASPVKDTPSALTEADLTRDVKRQDSLDRRLLFVKNIPRSTTEAEMRSLHNGIVDVQLRAMKWSHKSKQKNQFAHIEFRDEKSADDAYKVLNGKTLGGQSLEVDYFGAKSQHRTSSPKSLTANRLDPCKLFISRYPLDTTTEELLALFPSAVSVELLKKQDGQPIGFAFAHFKNAEACSRAHSKGDGMKVRGRTIMVVYARKKGGDQPAQQAKEKAVPPSKLPAVTTPKPTVAVKGLQQINTAVVKGRQQNAASVPQSGLESSSGTPAGGTGKLDDDDSDEDDDYSDDDDDDDDDDDTDEEGSDDSDDRSDDDDDDDSREDDEDDD